MQIAVKDIKLGNRHRTAFGDIDVLAASIKAHGLLHPIVITPDKQLVCGLRRIKAYQKLERQKIPCIELAVDDLLGAESDENVCRESFSPSDAVAIAEAVEEREKEKAKERQSEAGKSYGSGKKACEKFSQAIEGKGKDSKKASRSRKPGKKKSKEKAANAVGMSAPTLKKAQDVVEAANEDPDKYADIQDKMDKTGKVAPAHKELKRRKKEEGRQQKAAQAPANDRIIIGDFISVGDTISDSSVDIIFTDPPYSETDLYRELAVFANRVLKPGGLCMAYTGHVQLFTAMSEMNNHLEYMWTCCALHTGGIRKIWKYNIHVRWKPILMYCKPPLDLWWPAILDTVSGKEEKEDHDWQQSEIEAAHFLEILCPKGGIVVDPMCGSGTTLAAAQGLGLEYVGIEIDEDTAKLARHRLSNDTTSNDT